MFFVDSDHVGRQVICQHAHQVFLGVLVTSLTLATAELAGTSLSLKDRYHEDAMSYQKTYADFMKEKTGMNVGGRMVVFKVKEGEEEEEDPAIDPTEIPAFTYNKPALSQSIQAATIDMGLLAMFNLVFFTAAFVAFRHYDAR